MILRESYLEKIRPLVGQDLVKVITGVRRCGKSVFLTQVMDRIEDGETVYLNFEESKNARLLNAEALDDFLIDASLHASGRLHVFLDEVQMVPGWELVVNSLRASQNADIYITGSNSRLLSGELATFLAGRYVTVELFPFSFAEFMTNRPGASFSDFIEVGGFPLASNFLDDGPTREGVLRDMYNSVLLRDVVERNSIRDVDLLSRLIGYLVNQTGHIFSASSISKFLKAEGRSAGKDTIVSYLQAVRAAYLVSAVPFEDTVGKQLLNVNEKYYIVDHGIRQMLFGDNSAHIEMVLENIVYYELLRRGYRVSVGRNRTKEIDFVAKKGHMIEYYQVAYLMPTLATREREFGSYLGIPDSFPKYVLTMDSVDFSHNGIIHKNIESWLLGG